MDSRSKDVKSGPQKARDQILPEKWRSGEVHFCVQRSNWSPFRQKLGQNDRFLMRFWDFTARFDCPRNDQITEQSTKWSHLGRKSDEIWCDSDWIHMVEKQWDSSIKDFREPPQLRKWSPKGQKWWKMVKIGFWEAPRVEFGHRVTGSTEMIYQL